MEVKIEITLFPRSFPFCKERPFFFIFYSFGKNIFFWENLKLNDLFFFFWTLYLIIIIIIFNNTCVCNTNTSWYTLHSLEIYSHNMYYSHLYVASFQMWTEKKKRRICIWLIYKSLLNFMWVNTFNTSFHLLCPLLLFFFYLF